MNKHKVKKKHNPPILSPQKTTRGLDHQNHQTGGSIGWLILILIAITVVSGVVFVPKTQMFSSKKDALSIDEYEVSQVSFEIVIPTSGVLEADEKVEVRNQVDDRTTIKWLIDEGSFVKKDDLLLELASDDIENRITEYEYKVKTQNHEVEVAIGDVDLQGSENDSAAQAAQVKLRMAVLEMDKWRNGDDKIKMNELNLAIETAKRNKIRYTEEHTKSVELKKNGFISQSELDEDYIKMIEANAALIKANLNMDTYVDYTRTKEISSRENNLQQAEDELDRILKTNTTRLTQKENNVEHKREVLRESEEQLAKRKTQLENCSVKAPIDGLVIYGTTGGMRWWRSEDVLQIGQDVYPNQLFFTLPDTSKLIALVKVHESQAGLLEIGMPTTVRVDAQPDLALEGTVQKVGVMAEQSFGTQVREYSVEILIEGENQWELKPAMRCKASIFLGKMENVIGVPLQAVFTSKRQHHVWLRDGSKYRKQSVKVGRASETIIEIKEGLKTGQTVLLREPLPGEKES